MSRQGACVFFLQGHFVDVRVGRKCGVKFHRLENDCAIFGILLPNLTAQP
jgi:hypothetical protein